MTTNSLPDIDGFLGGILVGGKADWPDQWDPAQMSKAVNRRIAHGGIAALLAERSDQLVGWPEGLKERLLDEARVQAVWEASHADAVAALLMRFSSEGIRSLVMKGTALAYSQYDNPAHRRRGDSDVLILERDLDNARAVLGALGWKLQQGPHGIFFQEVWQFETGIGLSHSLDLHWQPNDSPTLQKVLRRDEFFASAQPLVRLAPEAIAPPSHLMLIQGVINQSWHLRHGYFVEDIRATGERRLIWHYDNKLLAENLSSEQWEKAMRLSCDHGIAPLVFDALDASRVILGARVPQDVRNELANAPRDSWPVRYLCHDRRSDRAIKDYFSSEGFGAKLSFLLRNLLPGRAHLEARYPGARHWPLPLLQLRRVIDTIAKRLTRRIGS